MATTGAMAEFARMPTQRKVLVFVLIGVVMLVGYWKLVYQSLADDLDAAQVDHEGKVQTNRRLAGDLPKYEELKAHKAKLDELNRKNQAALPEEADIPHFFETLQHKVAESGAAIRRWTNRPVEPVESFVKMPVEVELSGTFMQIKRFFASLVQRDLRPVSPEARASEEPERIVSVENLVLGNPTVVNREIVLTAKFTAVTFRQEDRLPPIKPAGGAAPVKPAAAPPPMPSAGTPAGAKARVEDAIDKGEAKNRDAAGAADGKSSGSARLKGGI